MERIIDRGDQRLRVLEIEMLELGQLPKNYIFIGESVHLDKNSRDPFIKYFKNFTRRGDRRWLSVGEDYSPQSIEKKIEIIHRCGKRLQKINRLLTIENAGWEGIKTIII